MPAMSDEGAIAYAVANHQPALGFNDDAIPYGMSYWVTLVETLLKPIES